MRWRASALQAGHRRASSMAARPMRGPDRGESAAVACRSSCASSSQANASSASSSAVPVEIGIVADGRAIGDAADREPDAVGVRHRGAGDDGEIAVAAAEFAERVAMPGCAARRPSGLDQFIVVTRGRHHPGEEIDGRNCAAAFARRQIDGAFEREQDERNFGARIGVGDRAADRAAVAGLGVSDPWQRGGQQRLAFVQARASASSFGLPYAGADVDRIRVDFDLRAVPADA